MCRDNRHCPPDCKKKKIIYQASVVSRKKKSFVSKETSESFPGLNRAKISILFGPTTKLPLHCSATAIYIQDGNMVIVIKPLREFLRRLRAISRGSRRLGGLFSPIFLADRFLSSPPALRFPSYHPLQTTFFFLEPIIFTNAKTWTDACFYIFAFETYKLFVLTVNKNRSNRRMNVSLRLTRIVLNPLENFLVPQ